MGPFISIDGPGGAGKTTVAESVVTYLEKSNVSVLATSEPTSTPLGNYIRDHVDVVHGRDLAALVATDRSQHLHVDIEPALRSGSIVVCDRYFPSSLVLQARDGVDTEFLWQLNRGVRVPDIAVILTAPPSVLDARLRTRGTHNRFERGTDSSVDENARFTAVAIELADAGWPIVCYDTSVMSPDEIAGNIAKLARTRMQNPVSAARLSDRDDDGPTTQEGTTT